MRKKLFATVGAAALLLSLTACSTETRSASPASCAYVIGTGADNTDSKIHKVLYPGDTFEVKDPNLETLRYVPCGPRNFLITNNNAPGTDKATGDWHTPSLAYTKEGTAINVWTNTYFTLNQGALDQFSQVCFKYTCSSDQDGAAGTNFATEGWNGMLKENFVPAIQQSAQASATTFDNSIWRNRSTAAKDWKSLGDAMSAQFAAKMRAKLGYTQDLFCGSGSSGWSGTPGSSTFNCSQVRIEVTDVTAADPEVQAIQEKEQKAALQKSASEKQAQDAQDLAKMKLENEAALNAQRLANAKAIYGPQAEYWLGLQDAIAACKGSTATCVLNIGGTGQLPVSVAPSGKPTG